MFYFDGKFTIRMVAIIVLTLVMYLKKQIVADEKG